MSATADSDVSDFHDAAPPGCRLGERTKQSCRDHRPPGHWHEDAEEIRRHFGIPAFDEDAFREQHSDAMCYPDLLVHETSPERTSSTKGTDCFVVADRDAGKTTFRGTLATRLMEENREKVVVRGSSERSGWLKMRWWATLYLPANAEIEATWRNEDDDDPVGEVEDLDEVVRDVVYYEDVKDLLDKLGDAPDGSYNVVFPDPSFTGCEEMTRETDRIGETLRFIPSWEADEDESPTPITHWWFAFLLGRAEYGPFGSWMSLLFDEAGELLEEGAKADQHQTYAKIKLVKSIWNSSRKRKLSIFFFAQKESKVHWKIRDEFKWRIQLADGTPNPRMSRYSSLPQGFEKVKMQHDIMSDKPKGHGLCFTQNGYAEFRWKDMRDHPDDEDRWLKISLDEPAEVPVEPETSPDESAELEYDEQVFGEWQNSTHHRLYVLEPGDGFIDLQTGRVGEQLESPIDGLDFCEELRNRDGVREVVMTDGSDEIVVARVPTQQPSSSGSSSREVGV